MNPSTRNVILALHVVAINFLIFCIIFLAAEIGYRIYCDGWRLAWANISNIFSATPYSNLGTQNWVISDDVIGYKLNPAREGTNSLSMHEKEVVIPKPQGTYRIIFLGDSVAWEKPGMTSYTEEALKQDAMHAEVLNAAVPGYTTYQEMMFLKTTVIKASPDLVILVYCLNDNHKFLHVFDAKGRMLWAPEVAQRLKINSWFDAVISRSYLLSKLKILWIGKQDARSKKFPWEGRKDFDIAWKDYSWDRFEACLKEIQRLLASQNSKLCVVAVPFLPQLNAELLRSDQDYVLKPQKKLRHICEKYGVPFLDLFLPIQEGMANHTSLYKRQDQVHLNEAGQRLAAKHICLFLRANHLFPLRDNMGHQPLVGSSQDR